MHTLRALLPGPSPTRFARRCLTALERAGYVDLHLDLGQYCITTETGTLYLCNLYREAAGLWPWQRGQVVARAVRLVASQARSQSLTREEALARMLPSVRPASFMALAQLSRRAQGHDDSEPMARQPLAPGLVILLSLDFEETVGTISTARLDGWELDFETALDRAVANLRERTPPDALRQVEDGLYVVEVGDCYDGSRLLLPELLRQPDVPGELVAILPTWNTLILTGSEAVHGLDAAMAVAEQAASESPQPISGLPVVYRRGTWERLEMPPGHPNHERYRRMKAIETGTDYEQQKELLDRIHEHDDTDIFVASCAASEQEGSIRTRCLWSQGIVTLLPETDLVDFMREAPEKLVGMEMEATVSFDIVQRFCGDLMQPTGHDPPRWLVESYPDSERMGAMLQAQRQREATD